MAVPPFDARDIVSRSAASDRRAIDLMLTLAAVAVLAVVPEWPLAGFMDPSYWGVVGVLAFTVLMVLGRRDSWSPGSLNRRLVLAFLVALQLLYLAHWLRFGGSSLELGVQLGGLTLWLVLAALGRRSDTPLWLACVLHGVWDAVHFGRVDFVPQWYAAACGVADIAVGSYVLMQLRGGSKSEAA
jgi:hypothetical protein